MKTLHTLPRATTSTAPSPPSHFPVDATCTLEEGEIVESKSSASADHQLLDHSTSYGSRKRPPPQLSDPNPTRIRDLPSSQKKRAFTKLVGIQDHVSSLISSFHQSKASTEANRCQTSCVATSQLGQADTSPATRPTSEVKLKTEDIAPDSVKANIGEGLPSHATGIQGTSVNPSIKEEPCTTNGTRCDHDISNKSTCSIDVNFLQQVAIAFEEVKANNEESTGLAKESITMNPGLEPTFLAIVKKHGDITKDCLLESGYMLTSVLEAICKVVQELQKKHLTEFDCNLLNSCYSVVRDAEKMKVNVNWLRTRLDEIKDAVNCIVETKNLNDDKNMLAKQIENEKKDLESMKAELEKLQSEIERKENLHDLDTLLTEEMSSLINDRAFKIQQFQYMPLMEALQ